MTRLIRAADDLLEMFGTRTEDGRRLTAEWGEPVGHCPDSDEWIYEPVFTAHEPAAPAEGHQHNTDACDECDEIYTMGREDAATLGTTPAAPTPPDALLIAAVRKAFDSGTRLIHKADDPTSSYNPLARETVVLAALRAALEDADRE